MSGKTDGSGRWPWRAAGWVAAAALVLAGGAGVLLSSILPAAGQTTPDVDGRTDSAIPFSVSPLEIYEGERLTFSATLSADDAKRWVQAGSVFVYFGDATSDSATATGGGTDFMICVPADTSCSGTGNFVQFPDAPAETTLYEFDIMAVADSVSESDEIIVVEIGHYLNNYYDAWGANSNNNANHWHVTLKDGQRPATDGVTISESSLALTELHDTDAEATYTVKLNTDPGADVTVTVASGDATAVEADTGNDAGT
ncbi:MAG: hypothetical protein OXI29_00110, partial [bacterium]|nr:hypothetical protein [bacterium]